MLKTLQEIYSGKAVYVKSPTNKSPYKLIRIVKHSGTKYGILINKGKGFSGAFSTYYHIMDAHNPRWVEISRLQYWLLHFTRDRQQTMRIQPKKRT